MNENHRILITGSNGLLGNKLSNQLQKKKIDFLATSLGENRNKGISTSNYNSLDITDKNEIEKVIKQFKPTHVIHSAALTNVDFCENNQELCTRVNVNGTKYLFDICAYFGIHFLLLSTDFVFDGQKGNYSEDDPRNPLSIYAKSKVDAENLLINSDYKNWSIVRTIILYGKAENLSRGNLVLWAKEALKSQTQMKVIDDQFRAPTWADDLAWACIKICELNEVGVFHISGPETYSILEIVHKIAEYYNYSTECIESVDTQTLNQSAKRPPRTGFDLTKAKLRLGYSPMSLNETLAFI